jgi:hypothetical protein
MVGVHVEQTCFQDLGELVYFIIGTDYFFSGFNHPLHIKQENEDCSGKDKKKQKKNQ